MHKLFFLAVAALSTSAITAQCNELFISEYIEGWSNNKALEIYNPTANPINLSGYFVPDTQMGQQLLLLRMLFNLVEPFNRMTFMLQFWKN